VWYRLEEGRRDTSVGSDPLLNAYRSRDELGQGNWIITLLCNWI
jgi:hypothetical protein